jgi:hypothetical protein
MRSIWKLACVVSVVFSAGIALPAMAARSNTVSYAYFDASGNFVGQSLFTCDSKHFEGGTVTQYALVQSVGCYIGHPTNGDPGLTPDEIYSNLPPGFTQDEACQLLSTRGDSCGTAPYYNAPVFVYQ